MILSHANRFVGRLASILILPACIFAASGCQVLPELAGTALGLTDGNNGLLKPIDASHGVTILDTIFPFGDFDGYDLGPFRAGQRVRITIADGLLKAGIMLVDGDRSVVLDGFDGNAPRRGCIEHVLVADTNSLRLYIGPGHERHWPVEILPVPTGGLYGVTVEASSADIVAVPPPRSQTVVLVFGGGVDTHYFDHALTLAPFVAADYNPALAGREADIRAAALAKVRAIYADFALDVTTDADPPPAGLASRVYITAPDFFKVAGEAFAAGQVRYIDFGNRDAQDVAVVSTGPTTATDPAQFGARLGRLAAHEIGHLLGLVHQTHGLMAPTGANEVIEDGPLFGYFGFNSPGTEAMFPPGPDLIQTPHDDLMRVLGPRK